jgi:hypothetical protein
MLVQLILNRFKLDYNKFHSPIADALEKWLEFGCINQDAYCQEIKCSDQPEA